MYIPLSTSWRLYSLKSLFIKASALLRVMNRRKSSHPEETEVKSVSVDRTSSPTTSCNDDLSSAMVLAIGCWIKRGVEEEESQTKSSHRKTERGWEGEREGGSV